MGSLRNLRINRTPVDEGDMETGDDEFDKAASMKQVIQGAGLDVPNGCYLPRWDSLLLLVMAALSFGGGLYVWLIGHSWQTAITTVLNFKYKATITTIPTNTSLATNVTTVTLGYTYDHSLKLYLDLLTGIIFACYALASMISACYAWSWKSICKLCGEDVASIGDEVDDLNKSMLDTVEKTGIVPSGRHPWVYNHYVSFVVDAFYGVIGWSIFFYIIGYREYTTLLSTVFFSLNVAAINLLISVFNQALLISDGKTATFQRTFTMGSIAVILTTFVLILWYVIDMYYQYQTVNRGHYQKTTIDVVHNIFIVLMTNLAVNITVSLIKLIGAIMFMSEFLVQKTADLSKRFIIVKRVTENYKKFKVVMEVFKHVANYSSIITFAYYVSNNFHTYI